MTGVEPTISAYVAMVIIVATVTDRAAFLAIMTGAFIGSLFLAASMAVYLIGGV